MRSHALAILVCAAAVSVAAIARAGAPAPDTRAGDFEHVCKGGPNKDAACTVATEATDCPKSSCVIKTLSKTIKGKLTIIAHDAVTDWATGLTGNQALTVMLEVKAPDGTKQILSAIYQDLANPVNAPTADPDVVSIAMDEFALQTLAAQVSGLVFAQPENAIAARLQALFTSTGTPAIVEVNDKKVDLADHTGDALATVLRFKVKIQFIDPI